MVCSFPSWDWLAQWEYRAGDLSEQSDAEVPISLSLPTWGSLGIGFTLCSPSPAWVGQMMQCIACAIAACCIGHRSVLRWASHRGASPGA